MKIVDFNMNHVASAALLAKANYEEEREYVTYLPKIESIPDLEYFARNGLGVAALEDDRLIGFLCCYEPWENAFDSTAQGTFSPILNNENSRLTKLRLDCLVKVIENLSSRDQSVIKMLFEGYSGREMAQELGISECAQRKLVSDMRGRLAKGLSKLHYADIDERTNQYQNEVICMDEELDHNSMFRFIYASLLSESI